MPDINIIFLIAGGSVIIISIFSNFIKTYLPISIPMFAVIVGIIAGPHVTGLFHPVVNNDYMYMVEQVCRVTLAIALMGVALRIPNSFLKNHMKSTLLLLFIMMPLMFITSGVLVYYIMGLPLALAFIIGGAVTPTDPVVASAIVTGPSAEKYIPARIRHIISAESGANDGLAYLVLLLPLLLFKHPAGEALNEWFIEVLLWEVVAAGVIGLLMGYLAGKTFLFADKSGLMGQTYYFGYTIALSLVVLAAAKLLGTDGIFAVFISGISFSSVVRQNERADEESVQEAINHFFTIPVFILLGILIPWGEWYNLGWTGTLLAAAILVLRRLPWLIVTQKLYKPLKTKQSVYFTGWFGPVGVAALFYLSFSIRETGIHNEIWGIGTLIIFSSILVHGVTATPLTKILGRGMAKNSGDNND